MSSSARLAANAANAQQSTGPVTEEGKARASQNARKHGLTAQEIIVAAEDRQEFDEMLAEYQAEAAPQGAIEQTLFDELVASAWNLRRIRRMETELCAGANSYLSLLDNDAVQTKLDRLARHKTRIERTFHRCLRELKTLHTNTALRVTIPRVLLVDAPPLASAGEIAKRSQALQRGGGTGMVKMVLDAFDLETDAVVYAARAKNRVAELEKSLREAVQSAAAA